MDLSFVYEETAKLYSHRYGRPPYDPVVMVEYLLVGYLYGIPSERQIEQHIQTDVALRWYLSLDLFDRVPDHSTISQLRRRKPSFRKVFRRLFEKEATTATIRNGSAGQTRNREILPIQAATADSAYDLPLFHRVLKDHNIRFYVRPCSTSLKACRKSTPSSFFYDEENDLYRCSRGKELELRNLTRLSEGLRWVYYSKKADCEICPVRTECIGKGRTKHIERNYF